jgi:hypothetical protein
VAQGSNQEKKDSNKGFAGLSSMVSETADIPAMTAGKPRVADSASHRAPARPAQAPAERPNPPYQAPPQASGGSSAGKWWGAAVVIGLIWLVSQSGNKSPVPIVSTPSSDSSLQASSTTTWQPPPVAVLASTRPIEERPPVGTNNSLTFAQLHYCLAESIRMDAAKGVVNNYNEANVDRFNDMVADYNSRCGQFRYRRGTLETARSEVERFRWEIEADGRRRFGFP